MSELFPDFEERWFETFGADIFARIGGSGPPLVLQHGYPQTHAMWHRIAPALAERFTVIMPDLRGYGLSSCPPNDPDNFAYSKRAMGQDIVQLMKELGYESFAFAGHDRGARVGYRLALDEPARVEKLAVLDIVPTHTMWQNMNQHLAMNAYHWLFLAQPHPLPELLIEQRSVAYLDHTLASWTAAKDLSAFDERALAEYRSFYSIPERIHATCNDYRAGQTYDLAADEADFEAGHKIRCPVLAMPGSSGFPSGVTISTEAAWREWANSVEVVTLDCGHFVAEEAPEATLKALLGFLED
ncbi:alpha/beta hydrolase [Kaustia mangrovi]|uniref:Alpha/beta hydrolase n=1 Tax=Kaustia mangrovi TaxID=2593653 RepID=A0A7S8C7I9_9HYPH|nr:alpha/beta hydrolase [Kaustia mangrovi]QPC44855.1 alpha/beta hydrolase [Kaustia mangrovi]